MSTAHSGGPRALLIVLDGFGIGKDSPFNAIANARKPFLKSILEKYPHSELITHGEAVGLPAGIMGTAAQMLTGGALLAGISVASGEPLVAPSARALGAMAYLVVLGSLLAYVAFGYLLRTVRPALATSYAFVNPIVALALGAALAGERFTRADLGGLALVLCAVGLVAAGARRGAPSVEPAAAASPARAAAAAACAAAEVVPMRAAVEVAPARASA